MEQRIAHIKSKLTLYLFVFITSFLSCCFNEKHYDKTYRVLNQNGLYTNVYKIYIGGIYEEKDIRAIYLTDSSKFRLYLGVFNDNERFDLKLNGDSLIFKKLSMDYADTPTVIKKNTYSLFKLKKLNNFHSLF